MIEETVLWMWWRVVPPKDKERRFLELAFHGSSNDVGVEVEGKKKPSETETGELPVCSLHNSVQEGDMGKIESPHAQMNDK